MNDIQHKNIIYILHSIYVRCENGKELVNIFVSASCSFAISIKLLPSIEPDEILLRITITLLVPLALSKRKKVVPLTATNNDVASGLPCDRDQVRRLDSEWIGVWYHARRDFRSVKIKSYNCDPRSRRILRQLPIISPRERDRDNTNNGNGILGFSPKCF